MPTLFTYAEKLRETAMQIRIRMKSIRKELDEIEGFTNNLVWYAEKLEEKEG